MTGNPDNPSTKGGLPSAPPPPLDRKMIGRYDVIYPIAQGGMGGVHAGRLSGMAGFEKLVALKVVHPHLANETSFIRMFLDEARLAARIHHPNVGEIYEVGEDRGMFFMAGELILGQSLNQLYRGARSAGRTLDDAVYADIAVRVCRGLHKAHELTDEHGQPLHLVHRDVTPKNILISYDGFVKLIDFGVAFAKDRLSHTEVGTLKGKAGFMAPEQIRGGEIDRRIDVFSLGIVLYMCTLGSHPFPGQTDAERMHKIVKGEFSLPHAVRADYPLELEQIVVKALALESDDRYPDAASMGADLERFVKSSSHEAGTAALATIMEDLFVAQREFHQSEVRRYRAEYPDEQVDIDEQVRRSMAPPGSSAEPQTARNTVVYGSDGRPFDDMQGDTSPRSRTALKSIVIGLLLLGGLAAFWYLADGHAIGNNTDAVPGPPATVVPMQPTEPPSAATGAGKESAGAFVAAVAIRLNVRPPMASIHLDGQKISPTDGVVQVARDERQHTLVLSAPGYRSREISFVADADQLISVELTREPRKRVRPRRRRKSDLGTPAAEKKEQGSSLRRNPYQ